MKQENLQNNLEHLSKADLFLTLLYVCLVTLRHRGGLLRPVHILIPTAFAQVIFFAWVAYTSNNILPTLAVGNLTIVAIALFPLTLHRPRYHWVSSYEGREEA